MTNDDLQQASDWTRNYRSQNPEGVKAHCLPAAALQAILSQPNCIGVRAYYGLDDAGAQKLILVGYDANDNDILEGPSVAARRGAVTEEPNSTGQIVIETQPCPPCCSVENVLNQ